MENSEKMYDLNDKLQINVNSLTAKTVYNDSRIIEISRDIKKAK
jgi:hypothetical protein